MDMNVVQNYLSEVGVTLPSFKMDEEGNRKALKAHQVAALLWMLELEAKAPDAHGLCGGILNLKQGLGKTITALTLIKTQAPYMKRNAPSLVVCSKSILERWKEELEKFFDDGSFYVFHSSHNRRADLNKITYEEISKYDFILTTYDVVSRAGTKTGAGSRCSIMGRGGRCLGKTTPIRSSSKSNGGTVGVEEILFKTEWERIIIDESHQISNMNSKRFSSICSLFGKYRWCLTGTLFRNSHLDVLAQLIFCGFKTVKSKHSWSKSSFRTMRLGYAVHKRVYSECTKDMPKMPDLVIESRYLELSALESDIYQEYRSGLVKNVEALLYGKMDKEKRAKARSNLFGQVQQLRQICISPNVVIGDQDFRVPSSKVRYVMDKALEFKERGQQLVVFSSFVRPFKTLRDYLNELDVGCLIYSGECSQRERAEILEAFSSKTEEVTVLLITYGTGSCGLDLQHCNNCILLDPWWNQSRISQAIHRLWRFGQVNTVRVERLLAKNTIENRVMEICDMKEGVELLIDSAIQQNNASMSLKHLATLLEV